MFTAEDMENLNEIIGQIQSLLDRMGHMIDSKSRCPLCGIPSDGVCQKCKRTLRGEHVRELPVSRMS